MSYKEPPYEVNRESTFLNDDASVYEQVDNVEGTVIREFRFEEQPVHPRKQCVKEDDNGEIRSLRSAATFY